jgi:hypothetical protein
MSWHFRAGADAKVVARAGGEGRHERARRLTKTSGGASGYQLRRWSNSSAGIAGSAGSGGAILPSDAASNLMSFRHLVPKT